MISRSTQACSGAEKAPLDTRKTKPAPTSVTVGLGPAVVNWTVVAADRFSNPDSPGKSQSFAVSVMNSR
jgi:hypothetical protein